MKNNEIRAVDVRDDSITRVKIEVSELSNLEGRMLTIVDASISDPVQRKAMKDIVSQSVWTWGMDYHYGYTDEQWENNQKMGRGEAIGL